MSSLSQPTLRGNFVLVRADELRILLPQEQVGAAEYLDARPQPTSRPGLLCLPGDAEERVFAALSSRMTLLPACPDERFVVTTLGEDGDALGWCWNELQVLIGVEFQLEPLPPALVTPVTPVECYVEYAGELAYLCDASRLRQFALAQRV